MIYKFRSMFNEVEKDGPQLSSQKSQDNTYWKIHEKNKVR